MKAQEIIDQTKAEGITLRPSIESGMIKASGPREAIERLAPEIKKHKAAIRKILLETCKCWRWRLSWPDGRTLVVVFAPEVFEAEAKAYARRWHGQGIKVEPVPGDEALPLATAKQKRTA